MRVALSVEELRALATPNTRLWTMEEVKVHLEPWISLLWNSGPLQMFHAPCARSGLAIRLFVAAALLADPSPPQQETVDRALKAGYVMIEAKTLDHEQRHKGALLVDLHILLTPSDAERLRTARFLVQVFPKCAHCHTVLDTSSSVPPHVCSQCGLVYYCDEACEKTHRPWHEHVCRSKV